MISPSMPKIVLIVEDDEDTRGIYGTALAEHGYQVITAVNGAEGVVLARRHRPDVILMDIRMPVMNGYQAIRYLRSYRETANIPVCAISAYAPDEREQKSADELGFNCFLTKPIDPVQVVSEIEQRIGPPLPQ